MIQDNIKINAVLLDNKITESGLENSDISTFLSQWGNIEDDPAMVQAWRDGTSDPSMEAVELLSSVLGFTVEELTAEVRESFEDLLQRVIREEQDGTFLASHKNKGLLLPGLSKVMDNRGVGAQDLARSMGLDTRTVNRYMNGQRGVPIERALQITHLLDCLPSNLTTHRHLAAYHSPDNSRSNRTVVTNPQPQPVAGTSSPKKQSQVNNSENGRDNRKIADLEAQVRDLVGTVRDLGKYVNEGLQPIEERFQSMESILENTEDRISSLEEELESVKNKKSQGFFSKIFG